MERDDVLKIAGMTPERTEVLLAFLSELTEENTEAAVQASAEAEADTEAEEAEPTEAPPAA